MEEHEQEVCNQPRRTRFSEPFNLLSNVQLPVLPSPPPTPPLFHYLLMLNRLLQCPEGVREASRI